MGDGLKNVSQKFSLCCEGEAAQGEDEELAALGTERGDLQQWGSSFEPENKVKVEIGLGVTSISHWDS